MIRVNKSGGRMERAVIISWRIMSGIYSEQSMSTNAIPNSVSGNESNDFDMHHGVLGIN